MLIKLIRAWPDGPVFLAAVTVGSGAASALCGASQHSFLLGLFSMSCEDEGGGGTLKPGFAVLSLICFSLDLGRTQDPTADQLCAFARNSMQIRAKFFAFGMSGLRIIFVSGA